MANNIINIDKIFEGVEFDEKSIARATGLKKREQNGWKEKNELRYKDPEYSKRVGKSISETYKSGRASNRGKFKNHTNESKEKIRQSLLGVKHERARIDKMSKSRKGQAVYCKPITTPYGIFAAKNKFAEYMMYNGLTTRKTIKSFLSWLDNRLKLNSDEYYFISVEEYIKIIGKNPMEEFAK